MKIQAVGPEPVPATGTHAGPPAVPAYRPARLPADAPLAALLAYLGMPPELAERVTGVDSYRAVVRIMKMLPAAPAAPGGPGDVLAIVGEVPAALAVAATVRERLGLDPSNTLLAAATVAGTGVHGSRRLTGPDHAARRVAKLREETDGPLIVVVDAPADGSGTRTARATVEGLQPTAVWAVVDATRKTADVARLLADIGRVDAIAVRSCAATADPASVLQLGLPVALVDDRDPTPHMWADLLCRRLEEVVAE